MNIGATRAAPRRRSRRRAAGPVGLVAAAVSVAIVATLPAASAAEVPAGAAFAIQTNGPNGAIGLGDWYTASTGGAGHHYAEITIPCGWPSGTPVHVDLWSPEMNRVSGALAGSEEPNGEYDSTEFELYAPGTGVGPGFASPAPGAGIPGTRTTYQPGDPGIAEAWIRFATIDPPTCGTYVLRSSVLESDPANPAGTGNDQNGWRLRVASDDDADPSTAPPATGDDADGIAGTNDEIVIGVTQTSFQHNAGGVACMTLFEYVAPATGSVTFHNFDMDGNTRVRYYAPSDTLDPDGLAGGTAGTVSGSTAWNGSAGTARAGDTIADPEHGWWAIVSCLSNNNQLIQEGATGTPAFFAQPPTPSLAIRKSDGLARVARGQTFTYTIEVENTSSGATAGAANDVVVVDTLPEDTTFVDCEASQPAQGTWSCTRAGRTLTIEQTGWIDAGATAAIDVTVRVRQGAGPRIRNRVTVDYEDALGNPFPRVAASDVDLVVDRSDLAIEKRDLADPVLAGDPVTYRLDVRNDGPTNATDVVVVDDLPDRSTFERVGTTKGSCTATDDGVRCELGGLRVGAGATIRITVETKVDGRIRNSATVDGAEPDPDRSNNEASEGTTVDPMADLRLTKSVEGGGDVPRGGVATFVVEVENRGPSTASAVEVLDELPAGLALVGSDASRGTFRAATGVWEVGSLGAGASAQLRLTVRATAALGTEIVNRATATSATPDATPRDRRDAVTITVVAPGGGSGGPDAGSGGGTAPTGADLLAQMGFAILLTAAGFAATHAGLPAPVDVGAASTVRRRGATRATTRARSSRRAHRRLRR